MTIIQPNRNRHKISLLISTAAMVFVAMVVWGVFIYNQSVNFRHEIEEKEISIRDAEVESAELKNKIYSAIDAGNLENLAVSASLVIDENPQYVKEEQVAISN